MSFLLTLGKIICITPSYCAKHMALSALYSYINYSMCGPYIYIYIVLVFILFYVKTEDRHPCCLNVEVTGPLGFPKLCTIDI